MAANIITGAANIITGIVIAVVSAVITVKLSLKRFYSEKWWEKKSNSYASIIEAMHYMKKECVEHLSAAQESRVLSDDEEKKLEANSKKSADEISKAIDVGSFVICDEAVNLLSELDKNLHKAREETDWWAYLGVQQDALEETLPKLRQIARKDLKLK